MLIQAFKSRRDFPEVKDAKKLVEQLKTKVVAQFCSGTSPGADKTNRKTNPDSRAKCVTGSQ